MSGLAEKLGDVMSALGGLAVPSATEEEKPVAAGDYGYRDLVRPRARSLAVALLLLWEACF